MRKISGHVVSTRPINLSRAAKLISRFAAVENGSSAAVSMYLQRTADAFNRLVHFHDKRSKLRRDLDGSSDRKGVGKLHKDERLDGDKGTDSGRSRAKNTDEGNRVDHMDEMKTDGDEAKPLEKERKKKKEKKKRESDEADLKVKSSSKKRREKAVDSS